MSMKQRLPHEERVSHFWQINETANHRNMHNKYAEEPWQSRTPGFHLPDKNTWCSHLQIGFFFFLLFLEFSLILCMSSTLIKNWSLTKTTKFKPPLAFWSPGAWAWGVGRQYLPCLSSLSPCRLKVGWEHGCLHFLWDSSYHDLLVIPSGSCLGVPASTPCTQAGTWISCRVHDILTGFRPHSESALSSPRPLLAQP